MGPVTVNAVRVRHPAWPPTAVSLPLATRSPGQSRAQGTGRTRIRSPAGRKPGGHVSMTPHDLRSAQLRRPPENAAHAGQLHTVPSARAADADPPSSQGFADLTAAVAALHARRAEAADPDPVATARRRER